MSDSSIQTEEQLVRAIDQYEKLIFSLCYRMTNHYFDAQDLTQETFLAYYKALPSFDGQNEKGYLTRIATNKCLDYIKQSKKHPIPSESQVLENNSSTVPPPEDQLLEDSIEEQLHRLCRALKPPYDQVAEAYYCRGQTASQIAKELNKKLKTVQTQIRRARSMLQKLYREEDKG